MAATSNTVGSLDAMLLIPELKLPTIAFTVRSSVELVVNNPAPVTVEIITKVIINVRTKDATPKIKPVINPPVIPLLSLKYAELFLSNNILISIFSYLLSTLSKKG
jgi:hypothetical protein